MKIKDFHSFAEFPDEDGDEIAVCPACKELWLDMEGGGFAWQTGKPKCRHLRFFAFSDDDDVSFFNEFTEWQLIEAVRPVARKLPSEGRRSGWLSWAHGDVLFNKALWQKVKSPYFDTILFVDFGSMSTDLGLIGAKFGK